MPTEQEPRLDAVACISVDELEAYYRRELSDDLDLRVTGHLFDCGSCLERFDELRTFIESLSSALKHPLETKVLPIDKRIWGNSIAQER